MIVYFARPPLRWRTAALAAASFSRVTHCAPCSAGWVLERTFKDVRYIPVEVYLRACPFPLLAVEAGDEPVEFPQLSGPYPVIGAIRKRLLGRFAPWPECCLGSTCNLLLLAGVKVPTTISTPASLLRWLARDHEVRLVQRHPERRA